MDPHSPQESRASLDETARAGLLAALNELLEAERAGARVAMETGREIRSQELAALVADIHKDEVHWCGMLMRTIKSLGATPSSASRAISTRSASLAAGPFALCGDRAAGTNINHGSPPTPPTPPTRFPTASRAASARPTCARCGGSNVPPAIITPSPARTSPAGIGIGVIGTTALTPPRPARAPTPRRADSSPSPPPSAAPASTAPASAACAESAPASSPCPPPHAPHASARPA